MLTGRRPEMLPEGVKVKPRELQPGIPEQAQDAILKALSFYPQQRFERPRDFGDRLARTLTGESRSTEVPALPQPLSGNLEMAYVLFMDLVGYSAMPMDRQTQTIQQLQQLVRQSNEFQRAQASEQLVSLPTGDGMALVFFQNPVAAVQCAMEISGALRSYPHIKLRMGVHSGPVYRIADINTNRNVAGGGINLAQRVMDCGDAGHILVSKSVADVLTQLSDWAGCLHDFGEHEVKHGVKIHLLNLHTAAVGNPQMPEKLRNLAVRVSPPRSYRRLYAAGASVLALAIVVFAATQLGPWRKTKTASPPPDGPAAGGGTPVVPPPASGPAAQEPGPSPGVGTRRTPVERAVETGRPSRREPAAAPPRAVEAQRAAQPSPPNAAPAGPAATPPVERAVPQELRERMILLAARIAAVRKSLLVLERHQSQSGLSLRPDMAAARERVEFFIGEAKAALSSADAEALKRNLDLAERDVEKLESFLGR